MLSEPITEHGQPSLVNSTSRKISPTLNNRDSLNVNQQTLGQQFMKKRKGPTWKWLSKAPNKTTLQSLNKALQLDKSIQTLELRWDKCL